MPKLPLAVDIADAVTNAETTGRPLDITEMADELRKAHPEADTTTGEVEEAIEETADANKKPAS